MLIKLLREGIKLTAADDLDRLCPGLIKVRKQLGSVQTRTSPAQPPFILLFAACKALLAIGHVVQSWQIQVASHRLHKPEYFSKTKSSKAGVSNSVSPQATSALRVLSTGQHVHISRAGKSGTLAGSEKCEPEKDHVTLADPGSRSWYCQAESDSAGINKAQSNNLCPVSTVSPCYNSDNLSPLQQEPEEPRS